MYNYKRFLDVATTELVVDVQQKEVSIALMEDKRLVELQKESSGVSFSVGDIYLARVKKTMPGLNAAFIDVGYSKEAFLHYLDLGENYLSIKKYLKQITSDRKKQPESISKFKKQPELEKEGAIESVNRVALDGDTFLFLKVHRVKHLVLHITSCQGVSHLQHSIRQGTLTMVNMCYNAKISSLLHCKTKFRAKIIQIFLFLLKPCRWYSV